MRFCFLQDMENKICRKRSAQECLFVYPPKLYLSEDPILTFSSRDKEQNTPNFPFPLIVQSLETTLQMMIGWWLMVPLGAEQPEAPCTSLQIGILSLQASSAEREYCLASWKLTSRQLTTQNQPAIQPTLQIGILSFEASSAVARKRILSDKQEGSYSPADNRQIKSHQPWRSKLSKSQGWHLESWGTERSGERENRLAYWQLESNQLSNINILTGEAPFPSRHVCVPQSLPLTTAKEFNYSGNFYDSKHWDRVEFEGISTKIAKILQRPSEKNW